MEHRLSCQYIKSDGTICGKGCWRSRGCSRHFRSRPKKLCPICNELTNSRIGICRIHDEIYMHVWHESKKTGVPASLIFVSMQSAPIQSMDKTKHYFSI